MERILWHLASRHRHDLALQRSLERYHAVELRKWTSAYNARYQEFPKDLRWLRPTRFGNVLASLESYPLERYGINLGALWPRLAHVMSPAAAERVAEHNTHLDFALTMSVLSMLLALLVCLAMWRGPETTLVHVLCTGASSAAQCARSSHVAIGLSAFVASLGFYRLATHAALAFSSQIQSTVDLYRLEVLDALDVERPGSPAQEREIWTELRLFIAQAELPAAHVKFRELPPGGA